MVMLFDVFFPFHIGILDVPWFTNFLDFLMLKFYFFTNGHQVVDKLLTHFVLLIGILMFVVNYIFI